MISLLLNVGYEPLQILSAGTSTNFFDDFTSCTVSEKFSEIRNNSGLIPTESATRQLEKMISSRMGSIPTMDELFKITKKKLVIVSYNLTEKRTEYISHETYPEMSCITAVITSITIPFLFYKVIYNGFNFIDGAFSNPLPVDAFDNGKDNILGIYTENEMNPHSEDSFSNYVHNIITCPISRIREYIIASSSDRCRFLSLRSNIIDIIGITLSLNDKVDMFVAGIGGAKLLIRSLSSNNQRVYDQRMTMRERLDRVNERVVRTHTTPRLTSIDI